MQMKYMLSCLFVLFKGFSFLSKFFYLAVVEVEGGRKPRKPRREGKDLTKGPGEGKKMLNLLFARFIIFCYSSVLIPGICYVVVMAYDYVP